MKKTLNQPYQIITGRISIPVSTPITAPASLILSPQNPILADFQIFATHESVATFGFIIKESGGRQIYPALGSNGGAGYTDSPMWAGCPRNVVFNSGEMNQQISGPGYDLEFLFYNKDATYPVDVLIIARTTPKIDLPSLSIQDDELLKKEDDS